VVLFFFGSAAFLHESLIVLLGLSVSFDLLTFFESVGFRLLDGLDVEGLLEVLESFPFS